jgi:hypothetical protein
MGKTVWAVLFTVFLSGGLFAQVQDLEDAINNGRVSLIARGNGSSSGASLDGSLQNSTSGTLRISTVIRRGLFLKNSGPGQDMAATGVYLSDGGYYSDGKNTYIELKPRERTPVVFIGFCADFQKENPSSGESFSVAAMPDSMQAIVGKISRYMADHPDVDVTSAAQISLWLSRGETVSSIREKFDFGPEDEALARVISGY